MPLHDWTRVHAGEFHAFHNGWLFTLQQALNAGGLPKNFYALAEQRATPEGENPYGPDVLALERRNEPSDVGLYGDDGADGGVAVAEPPPETSLQAEVDEEAWYALRRRTLAIRHRSRDRPVAFVEIASPGNKDRPAAVEAFVDKCASAFAGGLHLVVVDLFPPRANDPGGLALTVARAVGLREFKVPPDVRVPAVSFESGRAPMGYAEPFWIGDELPTLPLFYAAGRYINLALQPAYTAALAAMPDHLRRAVGGE